MSYFSLQPYDFCFMDANKNAPQNSEEFFQRLSSYDFHNLQTYDFQLSDLNRRIVFFHKSYTQEEFAVGRVFETLFTFLTPYAKSAKEQVLQLFVRAIAQQDAQRFSLYEEFFFSTFSDLKDRRIHLDTTDVDFRESHNSSPSPRDTTIMAVINHHHFQDKINPRKEQQLQIIFKDIAEYLNTKKEGLQFDNLNLIKEFMTQSRSSTYLNSYHTFMHTFCQQWCADQIRPEKVWSDKQLEELVGLIGAATSFSMPSFYRQAPQLNEAQQCLHNLYTYIYSDLLPAIVEKIKLTPEEEESEELAKKVLTTLTHIKSDHFLHIENGYLLPYLHKMITLFEIKPEAIFKEIYLKNADNAEQNYIALVNNESSIEQNKLITQESVAQFQKFKFLLTLPHKPIDIEHCGAPQGNFLHYLFSHMTLRALGQTPELELFFKNLQAFMATPEHIAYWLDKDTYGFTPLEIFEKKCAAQQHDFYQGIVSIERAFAYCQAQLEALKTLQEKMFLSSVVEAKTIYPTTRAIDNKNKI